MFEKLSKRERILTFAVLFLVPAALLFMGVFWMIDKTKTNSDAIAAATTLKADEKFRETAGQLARDRRDYYDSVSLSPSVADASNEYKTWLRTLLKESNLRYSSFPTREGDEFKVNRNVIGKVRKFSVPATGKLDDLTYFLTKFYAVDALHKIKSLKVIPKNEPGSNEKKIRTGMLSIGLDIEVCCLVTAKENPDFFENKRTLAESAEEYKEAILKRNIFGPPNNQPTVAARPSSSYTSGSKATISVTGKDADDKDVLSFELVESSIEGAELVFKEGSRSGKLVVPGQKAGKQTFKLKVTDNGFPPKFDLVSVSALFKDRIVKAEKPKEPDPPKPPPYVHAKQTKITSIRKSKTGEWRVWLKVRTTGEKHNLIVGESFKLDKRDWLVKSIEPHSVVFQVDGELQTFNEGVPFDSPIDVVVLDVKKPESDPEADTSKVEGLDSEAAPTPRIKVSMLR